MEHVDAGWALACEGYVVSLAAFWVAPHVGHDGASAHVRKYPERHPARKR